MYDKIGGIMRFSNKICVEIQALKLAYHVRFNKWYFANIKRPLYYIKLNIQYRIEHIYMQTRLWRKHKNKYQRAFIIMRWNDIETIRTKRYNREQEIEISKQFAELAEATGKSQWYWRTLLGG